VPEELRIEAQGRLYDFSVVVQKGDLSHEVQIELKVDSALDEDQIERQMAALRDGDLLVYVLLGVTRFSWPPAELERIRTGLRMAPHSRAVRVVDLPEMRRAIAALASKEVQDDFRDLSVAYEVLLSKIQDAANAFTREDLSRWKPCGNEWLGFFSEMASRLKLQDAGMGLVSNPAGGFAGCWWNFVFLSLPHECKVYLQCEGGTLCFKISVDGNQKSAIRNHFSKEVLEAADRLAFPAKRPRRLGSGKCMTVAIMDGDYRARDGKGNLDWNYLSETLKTASLVIDQAVQNYCKAYQADGERQSTDSESCEKQQEADPWQIDVLVS
jgi:hypothetical protein